jgi:hypothetical protein
MGDAMPAEPQAVAAAARQPWETPQLVEHGDLLDITRAVGGAGPGDGLFSDGPS